MGYGWCLPVVSGCWWAISGAWQVGCKWARVDAKQTGRDAGAVRVVGADMVSAYLELAGVGG